MSYFEFRHGRAYHPLDNVNTALCALEDQAGRSLVGRVEGAPHWSALRVRVTDRRSTDRQRFAEVEYLKGKLIDPVVVVALRADPEAAAVVGVRIAGLPGLERKLRRGVSTNTGLDLALQEFRERLGDAQDRADDLYRAVDRWCSLTKERRELPPGLQSERVADELIDIEADVRESLWGRDERIVNLWTVAVAIGGMKNSEHAALIGSVLPKIQPYRLITLEETAHAALAFLDAATAATVGDRHRPMARHDQLY